MPKAPVTGARASFAEGGVALVDLARALTAATDFQRLEHAVIPRSRRLKGLRANTVARSLSPPS